MNYDFTSPASFHTVFDVLLKLGVGALLGGAVGWEREMHGRPAGIRTHMLMVVGVILFSEVSRAFAPGDTARIAAQIVTGIGFLGAGTILRNGVEIQGLTSAASIWAMSAIGMAVSVGGPFLVIAFVGTVLTLLTLNVVERLEALIAPNLRPHELEVTIQERGQLVALLEAMATKGGRVSGIQITQHGPPVTVLLTVQGNRDELVKAATAVTGVTSAATKR